MSHAESEGPVSEERSGQMDRLTREHELKCWPEFFEAIERGNKTFEVRKDDRGFDAGDTLWLREWNPDSQQYTGREMRRAVTYLFDLGCPMVGKRGFVVMALASLDAREQPSAWRMLEFISVPNHQPVAAPTAEHGYPVAYRYPDGTEFAFSIQGAITEIVRLRALAPTTEREGALPNPTEADLADPIFEAIWQATKTWDVNAPEYYKGYCNMNGSHVMLIINAIRALAHRGDSVTVPRELLERIDESLQRHLDDHAPRRIPVDSSDADIVQSEVRRLLSAAPQARPEGKR